MIGRLLSREDDAVSLRNLTTALQKVPSTKNEFLQLLGTPHIESFNYAVNDGLKYAVKDLNEVEFSLPNGDTVVLKLEGACLKPSSMPEGMQGMKSVNVFPSECRQRGDTYKGTFIVNLSCFINGSLQYTFERNMGEIPIMVKSNRCHLENLTPQQLVDKGEHPDEWGGYFIVQGHEKLIRMLVMLRSNYPLALSRSSWKERGVDFTELGIMIRCVKADRTSCNNQLHFETTGSVKLMFGMRLLYYVPVVMIMKSLCDVTDEFIFRQLTANDADNEYLKGCVRGMLTTVHKCGLHSQALIKMFIGKTFRTRLTQLPARLTDTEICDFILREYILIHLDDPVDKFNMLVMMVQKLYALAQNQCRAESRDSPMLQELLLGGHLYLQFLKDRLQSFLFVIKAQILKLKGNANGSLTEAEFQKAVKYSGKMESSMRNFLSTGRLRTKNLAIPQNEGLVIIAENINRQRYMSHFRSVHRGAFFQDMRTTDIRQLLPEAWGFICPVHTPDGAPCGLLNHLTKYCQVTNIADPKLVANIPRVLVALGMVPLDSVMAGMTLQKDCYLVMLDGRMLGHIPMSEAKDIVNQLRCLKIEGQKVPKTLEIGFIPKLSDVGQYPGLFLFTGPARMMRPVYNLAVNKIELIGTLEQVYMDICITPSEAYPGVTTHMEVSKTSFLSNLACLIPMPDCNQSPRNMYQCQMGKQTMGTPCHTWQLQNAVKLYRLQTPTSPLFRPVHYDLMGLDDYPMGINAIVAVISYTGYDMEDAMVINKASSERGFGHGMIYKTHFVQLPTPKSYFGRDPNSPHVMNLDSDGLPRVGSVLKEGDIYCCYFNEQQAKYYLEKWKSSEDSYVDNVRLCSFLDTRSKPAACITVRIPRSPAIGDKFASRAGQKGICSQKWAAEDLPFTETGLVPDIVFNPHGFPSRMTIAMMIEIMAGKSAAIHGLVHDATPFKFSEEDTAIDYFGKMLEAGGYNYYGTERMYSGVDGREMSASIFFGVVHYQRLRHMVSDKWQVRSTGPVDAVTQQPVKGRRLGGGIRFGEMERDALISHGASFLIQDRLYHCSDKTSMLICRSCGNLLSTLVETCDMGDSGRRSKCRLCGSKGQVEEMEIPYVYRYLVTQLAAVNINLKMEVTME